MLALGIDTSTSAGSVGLAGDDGVLAELNVRSDVTHSERLLGCIRALLEAAGRSLEGIDLIAVASGPGSFTGLRIGMATAKGLSIATGRPLVGFSTLETIAGACRASIGVSGPGPVCVLLDAGRGEVYRGIYRVADGRAEPLRPEAALSPGVAVEGLPVGCVVCGSGLEAHRGAITPGLPRGAVLINAPSIGAALARRALDRAASHGTTGLPPLAPNYLRLSDAENNAAG